MIYVKSHVVEFESRHLLFLQKFVIVEGISSTHSGTQMLVGILRVACIIIEAAVEVILVYKAQFKGHAAISILFD